MYQIIIKHFLPNLILVSSLIYVWYKLSDKKIDFKNKRLYITILSIMTSSILIHLLVSSFIKITLITIIFMIFYKYLFEFDLKICIITPIYYQLIIMISEGIYILLLSTIFNLNLEELKDKFLGTYLIINLGIAIFTIIMIKIPYTIRIYKFIIKNISRIKSNYIIILSIIIIGIANILAAITYYRIDIRMIVIINIVFTLFCCFVVFYSFKVQNQYNKVNDKYNIAINSLKDYEDMMTKYRINNHENKNLLLAVRAMIVNREKDIPKYIDSIVRNKFNDNEKLLLKVNKIPSGGLRATIYSEILKIKDKKIDYELNIDNNLKTNDLIDLDTNMLIDICKILGVFLDNAIEEVENHKRKHIIISLYTYDEKLNIDVSNNYYNKIDVNKIYNAGYTTKGINHGYGLSMVKRIIESNPNFENNISINKEFFTQSIRIKYKKSRNK